MSNLTFINNSNNIADLAVGLSANYGALFGSIVLFAIFITVFASTIKNGSSAAMIASSVATSIIGILMLFAELVTWPVTVVPVVIAMGSIVYRFFDNR